MKKNDQIVSARIPKSFGFNLVFQRKNPVIETVKMAGGRLPKGYPYYTNTSSYSFQDTKLFFCKQIVNISEVFLVTVRNEQRNICPFGKMFYK